jgi:large subunit ribosomal protein L22
MEIVARLRYLQASPQKVRLVADLIRGRGVQEATNVLELSNKSAASPLRKLLKSAVANAEQRQEAIDVDRLFVKEITVDGGPALKRMRPAPQGRAYRRLRRQSHITLKLDSQAADAGN